MIALNQRYSFQDICTSMQILSECYSDFTICRIVGTSQDDRTIPMLRMGFGTRNLICTAGIHGRESVNPVLMLRMMEDYAQSFRFRQKIGGYDVSDLLHQFSICFLPVVNPDGYEIATQGFDVISNPIYRRMARSRNISSENWKYNARGVDINRNFPCKSYVQQQLYEYPGSESETQMLMRVFRDYETAAYLDFHSRGKIIYYYRNAMPHTYNQKCRQLAKELQHVSGYALGRKEEELLSRVSGGNSVHFYSELTGNPAITIETLPQDAPFPPGVNCQKDTYEEIKSIPLSLLSSLRLWSGQQRANQLQ